MLYGNITECDGGVFYASVHEGGKLARHEPAVGGGMIEVPDGEWVRYEDVVYRYEARSAFPSLEAARKWCARHIERRGEPVPAMTGGEGVWRLWPE